MKEGISVHSTMKWLNISQSYVYFLIRNEELETISKSPTLISTQSIIKKIGHSYPRVADTLYSLLDYHVRQDAPPEIYHGSQ